MKTNLRTFTFCVKIQGCEEPGSYLTLFTNFCRHLLDRTRNEKTSCKKRDETKKKERKTEKQK